ncbi:hypothetical protein [Persicobacter diffluens]|uniref:Uncharacterized protein n=1 Tax=Persicobacter diffluens TaxID=981 RepID=A0AAN5ALR7_9BACT|nr:hypothetical protein PEDI_36390 [Persicobacter diffluens]
MTSNLPTTHRGISWLLLALFALPIFTACQKDELSPAEQQLQSDLEILYTILESYGVSSPEKESRVTVNEQRITAVDFSALELTAMDKRLYEVNISKTIDLRNNQLDMEIIQEVKAKFPGREVLVSGNPPYEKDVELETLEKLGISGDSDRVSRNADGYVTGLDLSDMGWTEVNPVVYEFPYLEDLNLSLNELQYYQFKALSEALENVSIDFSGNTFYEISLEEINRFQQYLDFNNVEAKAEEVLTFYTEENAIYDRILEDQTTGFISAIDLSAHNIVDLALPLPVFQVLRVKVQEIDLSNSSFGLDAIMDDTRVGAIYPTVVENNAKLDETAAAYLEKQTSMVDFYEGLSWDIGIIQDYAPSPFASFVDLPKGTVEGKIFKQTILYFLGNFDSYSRFIDLSFDLDYLMIFVPGQERIRGTSINLTQYVGNLATGSENRIWALRFLDELVLDEGFRNLKTKMKLGVDKWNCFRANSIKISKTALFDIQTPSLAISGGILECPDNELDISIVGENFFLRGIPQDRNENIKLNLIDGSGLTSESRGMARIVIDFSKEGSSNPHIKPDVDVYFQITQFKDLEYFELNITGALYVYGSQSDLDQINETVITAREIIFI